MSESTNPLSPRQRARAEALAVAKNIIAVKHPFGSTAVPDSRSIEDLLMMADWILNTEEDQAEFTAQGIGGIMIPLRAKDVLSAMAEAADLLPDCEQENCPIHKPKREAEDLKPEDAVSSFDPPVDWLNTEQVGMAEASDFFGGEADGTSNPRVISNDDQLPDPRNCAVGDKVVWRDAYYVLTEQNGYRAWTKIELKTDAEWAEEKRRKEAESDPPLHSANSYRDGEIVVHNGAEWRATGEPGRLVWKLKEDAASSFDPQPRPPTTTPDTFKVGHSVQITNGHWMVVRDTDGETKIWKQIPATPPEWNPGLFPVNHVANVDGNEWIIQSDGAFGHKYWAAK